MKSKFNLFTIIIITIFLSIHCQSSKNSNTKEKSETQFKNHTQQKKVETSKIKRKNKHVFSDLIYKEGIESLPYNTQTYISFSPKELFSNNTLAMENYNIKRWKNYFDHIGIDLSKDITNIIISSPLSIADLPSNFVAFAYGEFPNLERTLNLWIRDESNLPIIQKKPILENIEGVFTYTNPVEGISISFLNKKIICISTHYRVKEAIALLKGESDKTLNDNDKYKELIEDMKEYSSLTIISDISDKSKQYQKGKSFSKEKYKDLQEILGNIDIFKLGTKYSNGMKVMINFGIKDSDLSKSFTNMINEQLKIVKSTSKLNKKLLSYMKFKTDDNNSICKFKLNKKEWSNLLSEISGVKKSETR